MTCTWLEGRFVGVAARAVGRRPRAGLTAAAIAALAAARGPAAGGTLAAVPGAGSGDPVDLGRGVPQRGADIVDLHLVHGPLLALLGLIRPLPQPPGDNDPHPP